MEEKKEKKKIAVDNGLAAKVRVLEERIERMQANWKRFCAIHVGDDDNGKVGSSKIGVLLALGMVIALAAVYAGTIDDKSVNGGTYTLSESGGTMTLTVDAISADVTGDVTGDVTASDVTVSGTLGVAGTLPATSISTSIATNANGGTNVVTFTIADINGDTVTDDVMFRMYISDTEDGAVAAVAGDVAVTDGLELQQVVDKGDYWIVSTNGSGTAVVTITDTPDEETYVHAIAPSGIRVSTPSNFTAP